MANIMHEKIHSKKYFRVTAAVLFFLVTSLLYIFGTIQDLQYYHFGYESLSIKNDHLKQIDNGSHFPDLDICNIPDMNPYHKTILRYLKTAKPIICSRHDPLTYTTSEGGRQVLKIDQAMVTHYSTSLQRLDCCYSVITRVDDDKNKASKCVNFVQQVTLGVEVEFIFVRCHEKKKGKQLYANMHAVVQIKPNLHHETIDDASNISKKVTEGVQESRPNVLLLGIDSISRLNLMRTMPRTVKYLLSHQWLELKKYNKIGDNTLPNLMAILTGLNTSHLGKIKCTHNINNYMDHCPYLWKDFKQKGYVTAYAEDEPKMATFNYNAKGFIRPPTDYYFRPFMVEAMKMLHLKTSDSLTTCLGPTSTTDNFLKYTMDLLSTFSNSLFALIWLNNFSHNNFNTPAAMDNRYLRFMGELSSSGALNNTLVVFFSDHGTRFGDIRKTYVGWLEERLPFIYIWVPDWYREKYPVAYQNLIDNGDRLTSPYDLHLLLKDVVDDSVGVVGNGSDGCPTCVSLFTPVSRFRTCDDAGITPHWCSCASQTQISTNGSIVQKAAKFVVAEIDHKLLTANYTTNQKCAVLKLNGIVSARLREKSNLSQEYDDYIIVFNTVPGLAMFDATVRYWPKRNEFPYDVIGFISRINSYAADSKCINDKLLQLYCYCVSEGK